MNAFTKIEVSALLLAELAKNPTEWKKQYGTKTLAEVLSKSMNVETLIRAGVNVDDAVMIKGSSNGRYLGTCGKYQNTLVSAPARIRKSNSEGTVKVARKRVRIVTGKKAGTELVQRGNKMVVVGGAKKSKKA